ncbi:MAG: IS3 family transposase [Erysipelotrichaceae bacterium]|nr:IS3 family transposase [Erysipelotrichaceae bacterium]MBR2545882.1 IS3 family transposase [Erysipelotrichaceae bacterium]MBR2700968.1 IS3 family transposase [Erysipelotrichaceae bacterium]MBR2701642.1 IS3 family transposase [Erysipelotrichaceae bacterium]
MVDDYIDFYNNRRPQRKLKGMTPAQFRLSYLSSRLFL